MFMPQSRQDGTCTALDTGSPRRSDPSVSTDSFCASSLIIADLFAPVLTSYCALCCILSQNNLILTFFLGPGRSRLLEAPALQTVVSRPAPLLVLHLHVTKRPCVFGVRSFPRKRCIQNVKPHVPSNRSTIDQPCLQSIVRF